MLWNPEGGGWACPSGSATDLLSDLEQVTYCLWALVLTLIQNIIECLPSTNICDKERKRILDEILKKYGVFIFPFLQKLVAHLLRDILFSSDYLF